MNLSRTVHLHFGEIDRLARQQAALAQSLTADERDRAGRFKRAQDRQRYALSRAALRHVLAGYVDIDPAAITFREGPNGKPYIERGPAFNLSHTASFFLIGVAEDGNLGVDIERVKRIENLDRLAKRCFSKAELAEYGAYVGPSRVRAFFRAWTRKEAFIKALGGGLSIPLDSFSVSLETRVCNVLKQIDDQLMSEQPWTVIPIELHESLEAAVAWDCADFGLEIQTFPGAVSPARASC
jgi:4'-phosphopantetheinyl transferase